VDEEKSGPQSVWCSECGYEFSHQPGEPASSDLREKLCPRCGHTLKTHGITINATSKVTASVTIVWGQQYKFLLDTAKKLRDQAHHEAAIVTAQTACEVCTEVVVSGWLRAKGIEDYVADLITEPLRSYNPLDHRVRKVYEAFSEDEIEPGKLLWQSFRAHVERRNDIVHRGRQATPQEADDSIAVAEAIIGRRLANRPD
jgi:hypothetical protein